jgi:hypothetical protein
VLGKTLEKRMRVMVAVRKWESISPTPSPRISPTLPLTPPLSSSGTSTQPR